MTFKASSFKPADAAPYYGFATVVVPVNSSEHFTAVAANDYLGEAVVAAITAFLTIGAGLNNSSAHQFFLHSHVYFFWNNGFMVTFNIILWNNAGVLHSSLVKEVSGVGLLQKGITDVFLIAENLVDGAGVPFGFACAGKN